MISRLFFCVLILCVTETFATHQDFYQQGNFAQAIHNLEQAIPQLQPGSTKHFNAIIRLAVTYQKAGNNYTTAYDLFQQALTLSNENTVRQILVHSYLGDLLLVMQQPNEAITHMEKYLETARSLGYSTILVNFLNNFGNALAVEQYYAKAVQIYQEAIEIAQHINNQNLYIQTLLNQLRLDSKLNSLEPKKLAEAIIMIEKLPTNYDKAFYLLEVLLLTREAVFAAQNIPDILYIWETQLGHILLAQKKLTEALTIYKQALEHLQLVRQKLNIGLRNSQENFYQHIKPIYYSIADILLQLAKLTTDKKDLLIQARDIVEQLKEAELQDYFQDECISAVKSNLKQLDNLSENTAVFYPILLKDRIELLITIGKELQQVVIPVSHARINATVLEFRANLQRTTEGSFIIQAKQLFQWLIAPMLEEFDKHKITTLIIVPDGILRTIPMAV